MKFYKCHIYEVEVEVENIREKVSIQMFPFLILLILNETSKYEQNKDRNKDNCKAIERSKLLMITK